ncbi:hypothetical protein NPIL_420491 [Nephila pilipes]|uniref:Uncharacterized protein n=1 Tax=Nephila pilipes TaxID=299642 RepID=A0A8X6MJZ9_NEPPI|nr:hypothetical protein NPIL_420491 [Nephila pilipes]
MLNVPLFKLSVTTSALDKIIASVQKRAGKKKEAVVKKDSGGSPAKTQVVGVDTAKPKAKKRAADANGFQKPPKHLTVRAGKSISNYLPVVQTTPPSTSFYIADEASINCEEEDAGVPPTTPTTKPKTTPTTRPHHFFHHAKG